MTETVGTVVPSQSEDACTEKYTTHGNPCKHKAERKGKHSCGTRCPE